MQITTNGTQGGLLVGETDKDGGVGIKAKTPTKEVILGGGEIIINENSAKKYCEELSAINVDGGGVPIPCDVEGNTSDKLDKGGKIAKVLHEFKEGILKTSYGKKVTDPSQAMAIAMSEQRRHNMEEGGVVDEAKKAANEMVAKLSEQDLSDIKAQFEQIKTNTLLSEQKTLDFLNGEREKLIEQKKALDAAKNYQATFEIAEKVYKLDKEIRNQGNVILAIKNNGDTSSFTDKKGIEHKGIPAFTSIKTDFISFDEETILTDSLPAYIPLIDEEIFARKGYIFDAIRIDKDIYILATNGYKEHAKQSRYEENADITKPAEDFEQGYVLVTLDQLALISDYYHKKAKATIEKRAQEADKRNEEYYDKLPRERREKHLNQVGFYRTLPANVKKKISQSDYEALPLEEKEKHYKPFAKGVRKRLNSKLSENEMWVSFHQMYERFINPLAVPPKPRYGNPEVFDYWHKFRYMMDWKLKDIAVQRQFESDIRAAAIETSFGESNTDSALKEQYGILVKRQNGEKIQPNEIEQIRKAWEGSNKSFGTLVALAKDSNLKISHTGKTLVFASKAVGMYIPKMKTIAVSAKLGDNQFENIMAHEIAHWIDNTLGATTGHRYASDDFESKAGLIGDTMRKGMNKRSESDYINSTKECFARSLEQYYAIETHGQEATVIANYTALDVMRPYFSEDAYVPKEVYDNKLKPLIVAFLEENKEFFKYDVPVVEETKIIEQKQEPMETKEITTIKIGDTVYDKKGKAVVKKVGLPKEGTPFFGIEKHLIDIKRENGNTAINMPASKFSLIPIFDEQVNPNQEPTKIQTGDEGMWHGMEVFVKSFDDMGNLYIEELDENGKMKGIDTEKKISVESFEKEFAKFPKEEIPALQEEPIEKQRKDFQTLLGAYIDNYETSGKKRDKLEEIQTVLGRYFDEFVSKYPSELTEFLQFQYHIVPSKIQYMAMPCANQEWNEKFIQNLKTNLWKLIPEEFKQHRMPKRVLYKPEHTDMMTCDLL